MQTLSNVFAMASVGALAACQCEPVPCRQPAQENEVCIPGGTFVMGHEPFPIPKDDEWVPANDWAPPHSVTLDPYFIEKFEVTFGEYRRCVEAGVCTLKSVGTDPYARAVYNDSRFANYPMTHATYDEAVTFCLWKGKRLPTEAEWERAARGTAGRDYPWGNEPPPDELVNGRDQFRPASESDRTLVGPPAVGTTPLDVTPEGVHDLYAGVMEWTMDWYAHDYYSKSPSRNPRGPDSGTTRTVRGMTWSRDGGRNWTYGAPSWFRDGTDPEVGRGFRCVREDGAAVAPSPSGIWPLYEHLEWTRRSRRSR